ncbi:HupE/UreJ family protein [Rhodovulum sp. DZ06]|uniref:HupE/UreJ family protein n=1 Tax=Rhodovulum sp. DZ06 TaxID=3425126 RepID=UPI003D34AD55
MNKFAITLSALALAVVAGPAAAHTGGAASGLVHGLVHPVGGFDHLLAMLAVGLWSGLALPGRAWAGPAAFMAAMALGALAAFAGLGMPAVEPLILASGVAFGLMILAAGRASLGLAGLVPVAAFALAHGHAHGAEAAGAAGAYMAGFLVATGGLHLVGLGLARALAARPVLRDLVGAGTVASGLALSLG